MSIRKDIEFVVLLEEMKKIQRQTKVIGTNRRENDAEHSWHIATISIFLQDYAKEKIDIDRVIKMLLVHDVVEIYAGDTFAYDTIGYEDKYQRELDALEKLKSYLSDDKANLLGKLWHEFEDVGTNEAKFANAMDRLQPMFCNIYSEDGGTWKEHNVKLSQVQKRMEPIKNLNDELYDYVYNEVLKAVDKGFLLPD